MGDLREACKKALEQGLANQVSGSTAIIFTGNADRAKLAEVELAYSKEVRKKQLKRISKEQEAERLLRDFAITF
jgi:ribosomal protein L10